MAIELLVPKPRIIVPKPKSYVKLDMAFGVGAGATLFDKSRYRSHGAITGASWATGAHGYALDFNPPTPSYVEIPATHTQLNFTSEDFSFIARVKVDDLTSDRTVFCRGLHATDGYRIVVASAGTIYLITYQSGAFQISDSALAAILVGTDYTIGFSRDGASVIPYVNGVASVRVVGTHINPATSARSAKIGIYDDKSSEPWDGPIEFLRIFGGIALPASTHLAYHNALK